MNGKIKITWDVAKWIIGVIFAAGVMYASFGRDYETKDHADGTFVKKEIYAKDMEYNKLDHDRIIKGQDNIIDKLDRLDKKMDRRK